MHIGGAKSAMVLHNSSCEIETRIKFEQTKTLIKILGHLPQFNEIELEIGYCTVKIQGVSI